MAERCVHDMLTGQCAWCDKRPGAGDLLVVDPLEGAGYDDDTGVDRGSSYPLRSIIAEYRTTCPGACGTTVHPGQTVYLLDEGWVCEACAGSS